MADLEDIPPDEIPSVPDEPRADQPVANPEAVAQEDEDSSQPTGFADSEDPRRDA